MNVLIIYQTEYYFSAPQL